MKRLLTVAILPALLPACTITPPINAKPSAENVALTCGALPVTENLWGESYSNMANSKVDPDWAQPFYEGFGTAARVLATPFYVVADVLVAPLRIGQPCNPTVAPTETPTVRPTASKAKPRPQVYRKPGSAMPAGASGSSRSRSRQAPPPPAIDPDLVP